MIKKHTLLLTALVLAAFSAVSCIQKEQAQEGPQPAGEGILLTLDTGGMQLVTKAQPTERPGDEDGQFNENKLAGSAQVFFFDPDADDDTPARWNNSIALNGSLLQINTTMADLAAIFGSRAPQAGDQATVIVAVNYDGTAFDMEGHKYTKNEVKAMPLKRADWSELPQDYFVMLSDEALITLVDPTSTTPATGTVKMRRRAAKVTFRLTIAEEIAVENYSYSTDTDGNITANKSIEIWHPQVTKMTVYSQYFINEGNLGGTPAASPTSKSDEKLYTGVDNPHKLVETTEMVSRERKVFQKDADDNYIKDADGNFVYETQYVDVPLFITQCDGINGPFYTYPVVWDPGIETEPFLKLIIPWESGTDHRVKYYYYKIPFQVESLDANNWYEVTLDVQILGGEEQLPVPLDANYHVVDWVPGAEYSTSTVSARYLSVPVKSFTMYNTEELEIPMISSHPCAISNITITYPDYTNNTIKTATLGADDFITVDGLDNIKLKHRINNVMGANLDLVPYTISFKVYQLSDSNYYADVTVVQYPAISTENIAGGSSFVDGYFAHVYDATNTGRVSLGNTYQGYYRSGTYNNTSRSNGVNTPYGSLHYDVASNYSLLDLTKLTVTAFQADYNTFVDHSGESVQYVISDPRVNSGWGSSDLVSYLNDNNGTTSWGETAAQIKVGTSETNVLAPALLFSSAWNSMRGGSGPISFTEAQKRCATYQEGGYPAGRWRLATEAEINFVARLQGYEKINELFGNNQSYWSSSGYTVKCGTNVTYSNTESTGAVRCVYDVWYWGDTAKSVSTYWPEPTDDN